MIWGRKDRKSERSAMKKLENGNRHLIKRIARRHFNRDFNSDLSFVKTKGSIIHQQN